ncbi:MAG: hypothetical protein ACJAS1_000436 [Oleiphilaceae bacterium]|jgi:hypothetical protein
MPEFTICSYDEAKAGNFGAGENDKSSTGWLTGHHLIPDHCFFYTGGLRGRGDVSGFLIPVLKGKGYTEGSAPVILLSSDHTGAPTANHKTAHDTFDPIENKVAIKGGYEWTYAEAVEASVKSLKVFGREEEVRGELKKYFVDKMGLDDESILRAGTAGKTMSSYNKVHKSKRNLRAKPYG